MTRFLEPKATVIPGVAKRRPGIHGSGCTMAPGSRFAWPG